MKLGKLHINLQKMNKVAHSNKEVSGTHIYEAYWLTSH